MKKNGCFVGVSCAKMQPTKQHRPAIWECMLGTVYALNDEGKCRYFDYDHSAARAFAGIDATADNRVARINRQTSRGYVRSGCTEANPRFGRLVLWVPKKVKVPAPGA